MLERELAELQIDWPETPDVAIVSYKVTGVSVQWKGYATSTWARRNGKWETVFSAAADCSAFSMTVGRTAFLAFFPAFLLAFFLAAFVSAFFSAFLPAFFCLVFAIVSRFRGS